MRGSAVLAIYFMADLVGPLLFLASVLAISHAAKLEERDYYDFGDSLNFLYDRRPDFSGMPRMQRRLGIKALRDILRRRDYAAAAAAAAVLVIWVVSILIVRTMT